MPEEKEDREKQVGAKKAASRKAAAKKPAKKSEAKAEETAKAEEKMPSNAEEAVEEPASGTSLEQGYGSGALEENTGSEALGEESGGGALDEEELSDEELRRMVEESLETVTVADISLNMMNQLASIGYLKMGLPENVNQKYKDFNQAKLAIDMLDAMLKASEGRIPEQAINAFKGTLANMQMNFVQQRTRSGG